MRKGGRHRKRAIRRAKRPRRGIFGIRRAIVPARRAKEASGGPGYPKEEPEVHPEYQFARGRTVPRLTSIRNTSSDVVVTHRNPERAMKDMNSSRRSFARPLSLLTTPLTAMAMALATLSAHAAAAAPRDLGAVAPSTAVSAVVWIKGSNDAAFDAATAGLGDSSSA
jgi:hypothetical protein